MAANTKAMIWGRSAARAIAAAMLLSFAAGTTAGERLQPIAQPATGPYHLGVGDEVRVTVFGLDAASTTYIVGDGGTISVPLLKPIAASGMTVTELEASLTDAIRSRGLVRDPSVSVQVQKYRPFYILGEVQRPGQYAYAPGLSVLAAVSVAGGYTFRADTKAAVITRADGTRVVKGRGTPETLIQPGDTITVREAWF